MQEMAATDMSANRREEEPQDRKPDSLECKTGPSSFPRGSNSTWSPAGAEGTQ
jgi:hypothetical protein